MWGFPAAAWANYNAFVSGNVNNKKPGPNIGPGENCGRGKPQPRKLLEGKGRAFVGGAAESRLDCGNSGLKRGNDFFALFGC